MNSLEILLNRRWVLKTRDKELYYQLRDELGSVKKFLTEKLGYQVVVNPYLVKVEKLPAQARPWMGIREFHDRIQYVFLCLILSFLEDKEAQEQFVLSELTEYIQAGYREEHIDWTSYTYRRHLIRVVKFCVSCGMLEVDDGSEDSFMRDADGEVLYENTGASRYFMRNFTRNIMEYVRPEDFARDEWIDVDMDRGLARRQRIYRRLLMEPGMYRDGENDEDFAYIRNMRNRVAEELEELFDCDLQVHRSGAFLLIGEGGGLGRCFPEEKTMSDIVLLCLGMLREQVDSGQLELPADECLRLPEAEFRQMIETCKARYGSGFIKTYREMTTDAFYQEVADYMESFGLIECAARQVILWPAAGKIAGQYPWDYVPEPVQEASAGLARNEVQESAERRGNRVEKQKET